MARKFCERPGNVVALVLGAIYFLVVVLAPLPGRPWTWKLEFAVVILLALPTVVLMHDLWQTGLFGAHCQGWSALGWASAFMGLPLTVSVFFPIWEYGSSPLFASIPVVIALGTLWILRRSVRQQLPFYDRSRMTQGLGWFVAIVITTLVVVPICGPTTITTSLVVLLVAIVFIGGFALPNVFSRRFPLANRALPAGEHSTPWWQRSLYWLGLALMTKHVLGLPNVPWSPSRKQAALPPRGVQQTAQQDPPPRTPSIKRPPLTRGLLAVNPDLPHQITRWRQMLADPPQDCKLSQYLSEISIRSASTPAHPGAVSLKSSPPQQSDSADFELRLAAWAKSLLALREQLSAHDQAEILDLPIQTVLELASLAKSQHQIVVSRDVDAILVGWADIYYRRKDLQPELNSIARYYPAPSN